VSVIVLGAKYIDININIEKSNMNVNVQKYVSEDSLGKEMLIRAIQKLENINSLNKDSVISIQREKY